MTNQQALQAVEIIGALPMGDLAYSPSLMLLHANLQQIAGGIEEQRRNLVADARKAAEVPDDFDERIAKRDERIRKQAESEEKAETATEAEPEDKEIEAIYDKVIALFAPAYSEVLRQEAALRFPLLTPDQFAALYAVVKAGPEELTVGQDKVPADAVLAAVAGLLVA